VTLNGQIIGQAERATRTLLERRLRGTGLAFEEWVALNRVHAGAGDRRALLAGLVGGLKIGDDAARAAIDGVIGAGLAAADGDRLRLTAVGQERFDAVTREIAAITTRLYGDVPADDLAVAGRVLTLVTERANAELAGTA
jgi:hypothetical protein